MNPRIAFLLLISVQHAKDSSRALNSLTELKNDFAAAFALRGMLDCHFRCA